MLDTMKYLILLISLISAASSSRSRTPELVSTMLDELGVEPATLYVDASNPYCDLNGLFGPVCNMTGVDTMLTISSESSVLLNSLEIEVHNASLVAMYPVCLPWVQIYGVKNFNTHQPKNSTSKRSCTTWLRANRCNIGSLTNGLKDVSLMHSTVSVINLSGLRDFLAISSNISVIEHLDWRGYTGLFSDSNIEYIISLQCNDNVTISHVSIGNIAINGITFKGKLMVMNMTKIGHVSKKGLYIKTGVAVISNTVFQHVDTGGIEVNFGASLNMVNVSIESCVAPCLILPFTYSANFTNVTIEGSKVEDFPEAVQYKEDDETVGNGSLIRTSPQYCEKEEDTISCDFRESTKVVYVSGNISVSRLNINNARNFHLINLCNLEVHLKNSRGQYTKHNPSRNTTDNCSYGGSLTALRTSFKKLITKDLALLNLTLSGANPLHTEEIQQMVIDRSFIDVKSLLVRDKAVWKDSNVFVSNATIAGEFEATGIAFYSMADITFINFDGNASISYSTFVKLSFRVNGYLSLRNITIDLYAIGSIFLTENGRLFMENVTLPELPYKFISVARADQVSWIGDGSEVMSYAVHVRQPPNKLENATLAGPAELFCTCDRSECGQNQYTYSGYGQGRSWYVTCNYTGEPIGENVQVDIRDVPDKSNIRLHIIGAKKLTLSATCDILLIIEGVPEVIMDETDLECDYGIDIRNSSVNAILNNANEIKIINSRVGAITSPSDLINVNNSTIGLIDSRSVLASFNSTNITTIDYLAISQGLIISNSNIGTIKRLVTGTECIISNSAIGTIMSNGIHVNGKISLINVTIELLNKKAMRLERGYSIDLENVVIKQGWRDFVSNIQYNINIKNVTLNGSPLKEGSAVELHEVTESPKSTSPATVRVSSTVTPSGAVQTPTAFVSEASSKSPADINENNEPSDRDTKSSSGSSSFEHSWEKWAMAGAAIFMGLCIVLAVLSVVFTVRRRRGAFVFPKMETLFRRSTSNIERSASSTELHCSGSSDYSRLHS